MFDTAQKSQVSVLNRLSLPTVSTEFNAATGAPATSLLGSTAAVATAGSGTAVSVEMTLTFPVANFFTFFLTHFSELQQCVKWPDFLHLPHSLSRALHNFLPSAVKTGLFV